LESVMEDIFPKKANVVVIKVYVCCFSEHRRVGDGQRER
jgi:hypothetical protein